MALPALAPFRLSLSFCHLSLVLSPGHSNRFCVSLPLYDRSTDVGVSWSSEWHAPCAFADGAKPVAVEGMKSAIVTGGLGALGLLTADLLAESGVPTPQHVCQCLGRQAWHEKGHCIDLMSLSGVLLMRHYPCHMLSSSCCRVPSTHAVGPERQRQPRSGILQQHRCLSHALRPGSC